MAGARKGKGREGRNLARARKRVVREEGKSFPFPSPSSRSTFSTHASRARLISITPATQAKVGSASPSSLPILQCMTKEYVFEREDLHPTISFLCRLNFCPTSMTQFLDKRTHQRVLLLQCKARQHSKQ